MVQFTPVAWFGSCREERRKRSKGLMKGGSVGRRGPEEKRLFGARGRVTEEVSHEAA